MNIWNAKEESVSGLQKGRVGRKTDCSRSRRNLEQLPSSSKDHNPDWARRCSESFPSLVLLPFQKSRSPWPRI